MLHHNLSDKKLYLIYMSEKAMKNQQVKFSVVLPCLNEERTLAICIGKAKKFFESTGGSYEILIADNGSTDNSVQLAKELSVKVVSVDIKGYGSALRNGIKASSGKYIIMGDADDSYDFSHLEDFVKYLQEGYGLVMGNRFKGGVKQGAMPWLHRYIGNPVLSLIGRMLFCTKIGDFHCGLRGFSRETFDGLDLNCNGMEFASEMVAKAAMKKVKMIQVPVVLYPDGRGRRPHLRTWSDGWAHLMLMIRLFITRN